MESAPWSSKQLRKLGACIRDEVDVPDTLPSYDDVMVFYNDVAAEAQERIRGIDWSVLLDSRPFEVTSRPKTIDTLRQKLKRDPSTPLPSIQDVAGVRFEAEMSLDEQDAVAGAIAGLFDQDLDDCVRDLRLNPHSGYRAVHLWLRIPARVEVQIRTHLQSSWANMYESLADVLGREIRYGELPTDPSMLDTVRTLQTLSIEKISQLERTRNGLLPLEVSAMRIWDAVEQQVAGSPAEAELRGNFDDLRGSLQTLRDNVAESEAIIQAAMDSLKKSFDSIRATRR